MLQSDPNYIAERVLRKLSAYYLVDNVEEVVMNRPGDIWVKKRRGPWEQKEAPELDYRYVQRLCKVLANINSAKFSEDDLPVVSCELPGAPFRFQAVIGPNVRYDLQDRKGVAMAIRALTADTSINLSSYGLTSGEALPGAKSALVDVELSSDHVEALTEVIQGHESIIISGGTSTGKTTFTNKVIELIPKHERIITVEDARELSVDHLNRVHLIVPRNRSANAVGYKNIIDALMRLTPDWIVCGELSTDNAQPVFSLMGKGHPVITTVHAGSPDEAIAAFANNMNTAGSQVSLSGSSLLETIRSQIGAIIQLKKDAETGGRWVVEIAFPSREVARERNSK